MQVLLRLLVLVFLLSGCGGNRKSQRREVATSMDSVRFSSCETNLRKRDIHLTDTAVWNLHRVVYFAPDSTGRQYPKTVTSLQMDYRRALADTGKVMVRKQDESGGNPAGKLVRQYTLSMEEYCCLSWSSFCIKGCGAETFFLKVLFNKKRMLNLHPD